MSMDGRTDICSCNICTSTIRGGRTRVTQEQLPRSKKPGLRLMVVANCAQFTFLAVNVTAVYVARLLKGHAKDFKLWLSILLSMARFVLSYF